MAFFVESFTVVSAGQNKQHSAAKNTAQLDRETEELHHEKIGMDVGKLIQKGRSDKKLTQKELAVVGLLHDFYECTALFWLFCMI